MLYANAARIMFGDDIRLDARREEVAGHEPGLSTGFWNVRQDER